jgi:hypothetical protein
MEIDQTYEVVALDDDCMLKEHPQNPNNSADELIDDSIEHNGWYGAIIAQKSTGYILAGNGRYRTAIKRKAPAIPVIWRDIDDETALRILLADNEVPRHSIMDEDILHEVLNSLTSLDGTGYGDALHSLEKRLAAEAEAEATREAEKDLPPEERSDADPTGSGQESPSSGVPTATDVPKDQYSPDFGIMIVCYSEEDQQAVYEALITLQGRTAPESETLRGDGEEPRKLRVVAV